MKEQEHYNKIAAEHSSKGRLFRNNTGKAFQGKQAQINGVRCLVEPRLINFGLCVGSSDLIGWTQIFITPDMIGKKIAIFTAIEVKKQKGIVSDEQQRFIDAVNNAGGIGEIKKI